MAAATAAIVPRTWTSRSSRSRRTSSTSTSRDSSSDLMHTSQKTTLFLNDHATDTEGMHNPTYDDPAGVVELLDLLPATEETVRRWLDTSSQIKPDKAAS